MTIVPLVPPKRKSFMTVQEMAAITNEHPKTWYRRISEGMIPYHQIGGSKRVDRADFEEFLRHARRGK